MAKKRTRKTPPTENPEVPQTPTEAPLDRPERIKRLLAFARQVEHDGLGAKALATDDKIEADRRHGRPDSVNVTALRLALLQAERRGRASHKAQEVTRTTPNAGLGVHCDRS